MITTYYCPRCVVINVHSVFTNFSKEILIISLEAHLYVSERFDYNTNNEEKGVIYLLQFLVQLLQKISGKSWFKSNKQHDCEKNQ